MTEMEHNFMELPITLVLSDFVMNAWELDNKGSCFSSNFFPLCLY